MKKGIAFLTILVGGLIGILGSIVAIIMPIYFLKIHITQTVIYTYEYDTTQHYLLTLLSLTFNNKPIYQQLGEAIQLDKDTSFIKEITQKLIYHTKCYNLTTSQKILVGPEEDCTPTRYKVESRIILPYNPNHLTEQLRLVMNE